jgi:cytidyltransferase-like protein
LRRDLKGAYPGTFDPPTIAHLAIAEAALEQCGLQQIDVIVNRQPLGKDDVRPLARRVEMLEAVAALRPWLRVVITDHLHLADIAAGYDVLLLGADKWGQVLDPAFYESEAARDAAVARLPPLAIAPRQGLDLPPGCVVLALDAALADVSSTAARTGRIDIVPPEVRHLL